MTGICLLESWVTVPDPTTAQKLELDPCSQMGGSMASPSLFLACSQSRSGGKQETYSDISEPSDLRASGSAMQATHASTTGDTQ
jgi:hypothetical protein